MIIYIVIFLVILTLIIIFFKKIKNKQAKINKIEKGTNYEKQIAKIYENKGYKVFYNGIAKGKNDEGIDLIAWGDDEVILIQCKNHETQIKQSTLKIFYADATMYELKNKAKIKNRKVTKNFVSNSNLNYNAKFWLENNPTQINFIEIKI